MSIPTLISSIIADMAKLIQNEIELVKLQSANRLIQVGAKILTAFVLGILSLLLLLFAGLWLSSYLSFRLQLPYIGFAITTGLVLLLIGLVWFVRKPWIERPLREYLLSKLLKTNLP